MKLFPPKEMNNLRVALLQPDLYWLQPQRNLENLSQLMEQYFSDHNPAATDVMLLPEMFTSGFTDIPEPLYGDQQTILWMSEQAQLYDVDIIGSVACEIAPEQKVKQSSDGHCTEQRPCYVNRLLFVTPEGVLATYDKCHLFRMGDEHKRYLAGNQRCVVEYRSWRFLLTICYDLRFPVFCRNRQDYDVMLCVANWPQSRRHAWRTLLQARAIENQAYVLGVNRVGKDGRGLAYHGDSLAVDMLGGLLVDGADSGHSILSAELSMGQLRASRDTFPAWKDADPFHLV
jgi:omega-amidase